MYYFLFKRCDKMKCNVISKDKAPEFNARINYDEIIKVLKSLNSVSVLDIECTDKQKNSIRVSIKFKEYGYITRYLSGHLYIKRI